MPPRKTKRKPSRETPVVTDRRVEVFASALHAGKSQSDAYRIMHPVSQRWKDKTVHVKASVWAKADKVQDKVLELKKESSKTHETTIETIDRMHRAAFAVGNKKGQAAAMTLAAKNLAVLHGLIGGNNTQSNPGVMIVPGILSPDDWSKSAEKSQFNLKRSVRD